MSLPPLAHGPRRIWFAALVSTGFVQAGGAALGAWTAGQAIAGAAAGEGLDPMQALMLTGTAAAAAAAGFAERFVGEKLAQAYVLDLRQRLFAASMLAAGAVDQARLVIPFVGDLTAVRNWAARGPAAIITASTAALGAAGLLALQAPFLALGLLPLALSLLAMRFLYARLRLLIGDQRRVRGRLTRFVMERLRRAARRHRQALALDTGDAGRLSSRAERLADVSVRRAGLVGMMDGSALFAGGLSLLAILALAARSGAAPATVISVVGLAAFVSARVLDVARASHALAGGGVALDNLEARLRTSAAQPEQRLAA